ncbi:DUF3164 family protein [Meridianimarinicoccus sp. RP-17]|uniref:DUF3164 family protein n=1 Tax=Meridianimarinicoccus zhengii TaxID=2056810 RepID=UPI000DAD95F5|nr:DUF3164 family protein [Phycocomes zhengii]
MQTEIPAGYMKGPDGTLVPEAKVKPQHKLEDEMVRRYASLAENLNATLAQFKKEAMDEAGAFLDLLAQEYESTRGGRKGNVSFRSYDGTVEMQIAVSESLSFGPELQNAKALVDACIERWAAGASDNIRVLVEHAFQVNKAGRIDTHRVLSLRRLAIEDAEWKRAMDAIGDALRVHDSTTYVRFYRRNPETGRRDAIPLDLAKV